MTDIQYLWHYRWITWKRPPEWHRPRVYEEPLIEKSVRKVRTRNYGLSKYDADIIMEEPETADYFEDLVEEADKLEGSVLDEFTKPLSQACAKFVINELLAVCNRHKIRLRDIPISTAAKLLTDRRQRKIKNQEIKEIFDEMFRRH